MFFTKKRINDKNNKNFQSNLTLYKHDQSTKIGIKTFEVELPSFLLVNSFPYFLNYTTKMTIGKVIMRVEEFPSIIVYFLKFWDNKEVC